MNPDIAKQDQQDTAPERVKDSERMKDPERVEDSVRVKDPERTKASERVKGSKFVKDVAARDEADRESPPADGSGGAGTGTEGAVGDGAESDGSGGESHFAMGGVGKHTLIYGVGVLLSKALSFVMLPVYTYYLTPEDYGVMGLIEMSLDVIAIMAGPKIAPAIFRFYHKADSEEEQGDVVSTALILLGVSYTTVGIGAFLAAGLLSDVIFSTADHTGLIRLASGNMIFQSLMIIPLAYARVEDRSKLFVSANAFKLFVAAGLNVFFLAAVGMGVAGIFLSTLITRIIVGSALTWWVVKSVGLSFNFEKMKAILRYGIPLVGTQFATFAATFGDRYFLEHNGDTSAVGLYNLAYQFGFLLSVIGFVPFEKVWGPKRFEIAQRSDSDDLLARGFIYANVTLLTVGTGISLFVGDVLTIMTTESFHAAASLVPVILIAYVFQSWSNTQDIGILVREKTEYVTLANWIAAAVALLLYWYLVPRYLGWGAAAGTAIAFAIRYGLTYAFSQRLWHVEYRWWPVIRLVIAAVGISGLGLWIDIEPLWLSLLARTGLFGLYLLAVWHGRILTADERARFLKWTKMLLRQLWGVVRQPSRLRSAAPSPLRGGD